MKIIEIDGTSNWFLKNFPDETRVTAVLGLCEEVGEVARAVLKQEQGTRGTHEEWDEEIRKEIGDVFIALLNVCFRCDIDIEDAIEERWEVIRKRDWTKDKIGHGI